MTDEKEYVAKLKKGVASSAYCLQINPKEADIDPKIVYETGMMVLLNKPIILLVMHGDDPLPGLRRIAHKVIELRAPLNSDAGQQQLTAELAAFRVPEAN